MTAQYGVLPSGTIVRAADGAEIPPDATNRDFQLMVAELVAETATVGPREPNEPNPLLRSDDPRRAETLDAIGAAMRGEGG